MKVGILNNKMVEIYPGKIYRVTYYFQDLNRLSLTFENLFFYCIDESVKYNGEGLRFIDFTQDIMKNDGTGTYINNPKFWRLIRSSNIEDIMEINVNHQIVDCGDYPADGMDNSYSGEHDFIFRR